MDHYFGAIRLKNDSAMGHSDNHHLIYISSLDRLELLTSRSLKIHKLKFAVNDQQCWLEGRGKSLISTSLLVCHWLSKLISLHFALMCHHLCIFVTF